MVSARRTFPFWCASLGREYRRQYGYLTATVRTSARERSIVPADSQVRAGLALLSLVFSIFELMFTWPRAVAWGPVRCSRFCQCRYRFWGGSSARMRDSSIVQALKGESPSDD